LEEVTECDGSGTLNWNGPLPFDNPLCKVCCPSVYTKGWVIRSSTAEELLSAFDVPLSLKAIVDGTQGGNAKLPFLGAPPGKVLHKVLLLWSGLDIPFVYEEKVTQVSIPQVIIQPIPSLDISSQLTHQDYLAAVKSDDAEVPIHLWDERIWSTVPYNTEQLSCFHTKYQGKCPLEVLRAFTLAYWRRCVTHGLMKHLRSSYGQNWLGNPAAAQDMLVGKDCLCRTAGADWWEWKQGSTLFFWRWPRHCLTLARDGHPVWTTGEQPQYLRPQPSEKDLERRAKVKKKLDTVRDRRYIEPGTIKSLTNYFDVPKGSDDIRMVYDASKSGLNKIIWVPSFCLPTTENLTDLLDEQSWMADIDMGEQFLNFPLDPLLRPYCGLI
jgi:hypothetical protein